LKGERHDAASRTSHAGPADRGTAAAREALVSDDAASTARARVEVTYERGLHARPASVLAQRAREFHSEIALVLVSCPTDISTPVGTRADAKNIMDVMFLAAPCGTQLDIEATGPDAEAAVEGLAALFRDQFGF
jgi:phosphotransferase system HPr (HPr) family protein